MKLSHILLLAAPVMLAACSQATDPDPVAKDPTPQPLFKNVPVHRRAYDAARGGVQITAIYFDQNTNKDSFNLAAPEEWIILESDKSVNTTGWWLDGGAGDGQHYELPSSINRMLFIFTRQGSVPAAVTGGGASRSLGLNVWIWNNTEPDTARIFNEKGVLVDSMTYE